jgi:hypothetical protein
VEGVRVRKNSEDEGANKGTRSVGRRARDALLEAVLDVLALLAVVN